jgi:hypothetical protein
MIPSHPQTESVEKHEQRGPEDKPQWASRLDRHLAQAAKAAAEHGVPPEVFSAAAWHAYLHASPALAQHIEQMQLMASLEELRNSGRLGKA